MSEAHLHLQVWLLKLAATSAMVIVASLYLRGWFHLRSAFPTLIPRRRLVAFITGLLSVWIATASPLAELDHQSLTIHMVKHLLLMTVAAPLVLAGAPALPLLRGLPRQFIHNDVLPAARLTRWLERYQLHPVLCWCAGTVTVIAWHLPSAFQLGMRSPWAHIIENGCFLAAGLLFWSPVVQWSTNVANSLRWSMALYLFLATLPCDILSAFLVFCGRLVYPGYLSTTQLFRMSPLQDQECAGALMWVWITFAYLIPGIGITLKMLSPQNSRPAPQGELQAAGAWSMNVSQAEIL